MTDWKIDPRHEKTIGRYTVTPERRDNLTAYRVTTPGDARILRVLPTDQVSAQMRSRIITQALMLLDYAHPLLDPYIYLIGTLHLAGVPWEWVRESVPESFVDWLTGPGNLTHGMALELVEQAAVAGWEIRKKGTPT